MYFLLRVSPFPVRVYKLIHFMVEFTSKSIYPEFSFFEIAMLGLKLPHKKVNLFPVEVYKLLHFYEEFTS